MRTIRGYGGLLVFALGLLLTPPLKAGVVVTLDFTTGYATGNCALVGTDNDCNRGTSFAIGSPAVVITARSKTGNIGTPSTANPFALGETGVVYWGDMGDLGPTCISPSKATCPGLGVRNAKAGGSEGISGSGGDQDELLVFSWAAGHQVAPSSIILTLQGFRAADDDTWIYLETTANSNPAGPDFVFKWEDITTASTLDFSTIPGLPAGTFLLQLGVLENTGHTGVAGLQYEAVPEPAAFILTGIPLLALGLFRYRARRRQQR